MVDIQGSTASHRFRRGTNAPGGSALIDTQSATYSWRLRHCRGVDCGLHLHYHPKVGGDLRDGTARVDHRSQQCCSQPGGAPGPHRRAQAGSAHTNISLRTTTSTRPPCVISRTCCITQACTRDDTTPQSRQPWSRSTGGPCILTTPNCEVPFAGVEARHGPTAYVLARSSEDRQQLAQIGDRVVGYAVVLGLLALIRIDHYGRHTARGASLAASSALFGRLARSVGMPLSGRGTVFQVAATVRGIARSSREIVGAERPNLRAISRTPQPRRAKSGVLTRQAVGDPCQNRCRCSRRATGGHRRSTSPIRTPPLPCYRNPSHSRCSDDS